MPIPGLIGTMIARKTDHPKHHSLVTPALRCHACPWRSAPRATMDGVTSKAAFVIPATPAVCGTVGPHSGP